MEWAAILIPIVATILLRIYWYHKVVWWEFLLPTTIALILILSLKAMISAGMNYDVEYKDSYVVQATYLEDWNEYIRRTCTRTVGSGKHRRTQTYDCSYVQYHPPQWFLTTNTGVRVDVTMSQYESFKNLFGNEKFTDLHRWYHTNDGDKYTSDWNRLDSTLTPVSVRKHYQNKLQSSKTVYNYAPLTPEEQKLVYEYPNLGALENPSVIGWQDQGNALAKFNAKFGRDCKIFLLVFNNKPRSVGFAQEAHWLGGNRNEVVVTVSQKDGVIQWCHAFSWCNNKGIIVDIRKSLEGKKLNSAAVVETIGPMVTEGWKTDHYHDFDFVEVYLPTWAIVLIFIIVGGVTGGISYFVVINEIVDV